MLAIVALENVSCLKKNKVHAQIIRSTKLHLISEEKKPKLQLSTVIIKMNIVKLSKLHLLPEERDIPQLEYIASNDKPAISVLSDEERKQSAKKESIASIPTKSSTQSSRKYKDSTTFGSLTQNVKRK